MKIFLLALLLLLICNPASAQLYVAGLALYSDEEMQSCEVIDREPGLIQIYVAMIASSTSGARFKVAQLNGAALVWLSDIHPPNYMPDGNSQIGVTFLSDHCVVHPHIIVEISYWGVGLSESCSEIRLVSHPDVTPENLILLNCQDPPRELAGDNHSQMYINNDGTCPCWTILPVDQTSWGAIKSLYLTE